MQGVSPKFLSIPQNFYTKELLNKLFLRAPDCSLYHWLRHYIMSILLKKVINKTFNFPKHLPQFGQYQFSYILSSFL